MEKELEPLKSFTLPGRRRAQRVSCIRRARSAGARSACAGCSSARKTINDNLIIYVNRLSDHLFVQSRWVAKRLGEPEFLWDRALRIEEDEKAARGREEPSRVAARKS